MEEKREYDEMAEGFAIVGCEDNPNFQVWGARSDLKCRKKNKNKILNMRFRDWLEETKWQKTRAT